jgi:hypothetical protein
MEEGPSISTEHLKLNDKKQSMKNQSSGQKSDPIGVKEECH